MVVADDAGRRLLRRRPAGSGGIQRHGDGGGLDVRRFVRRDGRRHLFRRLRLSRLRRRVDRRLCAGGLADGALSPEVRLLHGAGLHRNPVWRRSGPLVRGDRSGGRVLHLRDGADQRHRNHCGAGAADSVRGRRLVRSPRHSAVLDARRYACGDLDPGGAVHRADHRLSGACVLDVQQAGIRPDPAVRLWRRDRPAGRTGGVAQGR